MIAREEAATWDARLRAPDCSPEERAAFARWLETRPENRQQFETLQRSLAALRHEGGRARLRALRDAALRFRTRRQRRWRGAAAAAIAVVAIAAIAWKGQLPQWRAESQRGTTPGAAEVADYATATGQRSTFVLRDGSSIELNARSHVRVSYTGISRDVELLQGQAMFNVAKDSRHPFVVYAGDRRIIAVGTQFDVRLSASSIQVTLVEGKVRVEHGRAQTGGESADVEEVLLTPGKQLVASWNDSAGRAPAGEAPQVRSIDVDKATAWRDGRVFIDDQPLSAAVAEMNRHSPVQIVVSDTSLAQLRVNGAFLAGEQDAFVAALQEYFPISVERDGDGNIRLLPRR